MKKAAMVTGAARRIGRQIALSLAERGFDIALHYHQSEEEARRTADEIAALGAQCVLFKADLSDMAQVRELLPSVHSRFGGLELLVNSASIFERGGLLEMEEPFFDRNFTINFKSAVFLTRDFARLCRKGNVINMLDTKITKPSHELFAYTLSKKALAAFTMMAAAELAPDIRVNGICPGPILPPPGQPAEMLQKQIPKVPLRRLGSPKIIADAVLTLLDNDYITGQVLFVDGGQHLK